MTYSKRKSLLIDIVATVVQRVVGFRILRCMTVPEVAPSTEAMIQTLDMLQQCTLCLSKKFKSGEPCSDALKTSLKAKTETFHDAMYHPKTEIKGVQSLPSASAHLYEWAW